MQLAAAPTAVLVDDEPLLRAQVRLSLSHVWPQLEIVGEASFGEQAIEFIQRLRPDFAFLDIEMPGLSGLEVAQAVKGQTHVVFVTAYNQFALDAFEQGAVDYLLKPASEARLRETVARLQARLPAQPGQAPQQPELAGVIAQLQTFMQQTAHAHPTAARPERLAWLQASVGAQIKLIHVDDVLFFESDSKYTRVVTLSEEAHIRTPLKELLDGLDGERFWQIHRGTIVNLRAVDRVLRDGDGHTSVRLKGHAEVLEVSRSFAARFKAD